LFEEILDRLAVRHFDHWVSIIFTYGIVHTLFQCAESNRFGVKGIHLLLWDTSSPCFISN
jgi:hypothetical protein